LFYKLIFKENVVKEYPCPKCGSLDTEFKATGDLPLKTIRINVKGVIDELHCRACGAVSEAPIDHVIDKFKNMDFLHTRV
jgi:transcription elongation factor Elf1